MRPSGRQSIRHSAGFATPPAPNLMSFSGVVRDPALHIFDTGQSGVPSFKLLSAKFGLKHDA
jgi:hypothetical protein